MNDRGQQLFCIRFSLIDFLDCSSIFVVTLAHHGILKSIGITFR